MTIEGDTVRARAIGEAIVEKARELGADLIVMGSAPALAAAVALLQPDRRLRAPQRALRGDGARPTRRVCLEEGPTDGA